MATSGKPRHDAVIAAPFGRLGIRLEGGQLVEIDFLPDRAALVAPRSAAARAVCAELKRYLVDPCHAPRVPLAADGTPFERRVWRALRRLPSGGTASYGELARRLKTSARAIGRACRANPIPIVIPCHRVVARTGLGGFMGRQTGSPMRLKEWLLAHERRR